MQIAVYSTNTVNAFDACPNTTPTDFGSIPEDASAACHCLWECSHKRIRRLPEHQTEVVFHTGMEDASADYQSSDRLSNARGSISRGSRSTSVSVNSAKSFGPR